MSVMPHLDLSWLAYPLAGMALMAVVYEAIICPRREAKARAEQFAQDLLTKTVDHHNTLLAPAILGARAGQLRDVAEEWR